MDIIVEDLKYKDIEECYNLNKLIFGEEFGLDTVKKLYKKIHKKKDSYRFLVAKIDGKIVGYTSAMISYNLFDGDKPLMNLWWVGTHPDYRRQGVATKMFRRLEKIAKENDCELIFFTSEADNTVAHEFYKKMGFDPNYKGFHKYYV